MAIAQHYGIKTNYVDFTQEPEIAAFFAIYNRKTNLTGFETIKNKRTKITIEETPPCIICINKNKLLSFMDEMYKLYNSPYYKAIKYHYIDIPQLWRLQTQKGCFLELPFLNFERELIVFDKIIFPYNKDDKIGITKDIIYPKRKSKLEFIIDHFFQWEKGIEIQPVKEFFFKDLNMKPIPEWEACNKLIEDNNGCNPYLFKDGIIFNELSSWRELSKKWSIAPKEEFKDNSFQVDIHIVLNWNSKLTKKCKAVRKKIEKNFKKYANIREEINPFKYFFYQAKIFSFTMDISYENVVQRLIEALKIVWDGVRKLPYTNKEISLCLSNIILLFDTNERYKHRYRFEYTIKKIFGECIKVEYSLGSGISSISYANVDSIKNSIRGDAFDKLNLDRYKFNFLPNIFSACINPRMLFNFESFREMYITQIIPIQIVLAYKDIDLDNIKTNEKAIFFSPTELLTFGIP